MNWRILYRPVGLRELKLISDSGWRRFPPRLDWQPIFYPVLNQAYAEQIARAWNTEDERSGYCGAVTAFEIDDTFVSKYTIQNVGTALHEELWVPAEELYVFNDHINGAIRVVNAFFGARFTLPDDGQLVRALEPYQL